MAKEQLLEMEGVVEQILPNATFKVKISEKHEIIAVISGRMRQNKIQILAGDRVRVELSPYDLTKGRVIYRQS